MPEVVQKLIEDFSFLISTVVPKLLKNFLTLIFGGQIGTGPFFKEIGGKGIALTIFALTLIAIKVKAKIVRAIPLPPISLKKGPVPICPPNIKVKKFFNNLGTTVEIKKEKSSINFWTTSGMMAPFYELLRVMTDWLVKRGVKRDNAQKYITSLFLALSEDAVKNSKENLKFLVKESQTPKGLNEQGVKELSKAGFYKSLEKTLNSIHRRLNK